MAKRKVIWAKTAYLQRKLVLLYWLEHNNSNTYSLKLMQETKKATDQLLKFPYIGLVSDIPDVYCYIIGNYNLYYIVTDENIQVVCFWDNRQNPIILKSLLSLFEK